MLGRSKQNGCGCSQGSIQWQSLSKGISQVLLGTALKWLRMEWVQLPPKNLEQWGVGITEPEHGKTQIIGGFQSHPGPKCFQTLCPGRNWMGSRTEASQWLCFDLVQAVLVWSCLEQVKGEGTQDCGLSQFHELMCSQWHHKIMESWNGLGRKGPYRFLVPTPACFPLSPV